MFEPVEADLVTINAGGTAALRDAAAGDNKSLPIHRWVPWIAGFSAQFVEDAIDAYLPQAGRSDACVLDPFAGVATTLVEALKAGCNVVGYDVNAYAVLAARAKVSCVDIVPEHFAAQAATFSVDLAQFEARVDALWEHNEQVQIAELIRDLRHFGPAHYRSRIPLFSPPVEAKFLFALSLVSTIPEPERQLFRSALGAVMVSVSNYTYEPSLSSRPGAGKPLIDNASVVKVVGRKLAEMVDDTTWAIDRYGPIWRRCRRDVFHESYFASALPDCSVSLLVTSPPYMNNYHYVRNTRPQVHWLGLYDQPDDLRQSELGNLGKFWQTVRQGSPVDLAFELPWLRATIERLRTLNVAKGVYGGAGWANYVATYFNDSSRFLDQVQRQLKPSAVAIIVVGNSIIQGIEFKVDQILGEMAEVRGMRVEDIRIVRTKRVGNSIIASAVRNGDVNGLHQVTRLYDAAVILRG